jgi:DNA helicase-2/ATP-dependent DNA helicase PcrA
MVTKEIEATHYNDGREWEDFAVLFRTNDQSRVLEQAFRQRRSPIASSAPAASSTGGR